jgi:hypothetical protein
MAKQPTPQEIADAMAELHGQTDRGAAIIAVAILEEHLKQAILNRLMTIPTKISDNLFGVRGHISGFQAKIDIGFCLGLFGKPGHHDLDIMRQIRNKFAHQAVPRSFHGEDIKPLCARLLLGYEHALTEKQKLPRNRFEIAFLTLAMMLWGISKLSGIRLRHVSTDHPEFSDQLSALVFAASPQPESPPTHDQHQNSQEPTSQRPPSQK